jgi:hypothetical protein
MEFCHSPVAKILTAAHRVGKVNAPAIPIVNIPHRRGYTTFGHYGVCFA